MAIRRASQLQESRPRIASIPLVPEQTVRQLGTQQSSPSESGHNMHVGKSSGTGIPTQNSARQTDQFECDLIELIPHLRAFSRSLCGRRDLAEDMAQDALAKAWRARNSYNPGTNLKAWLFTILRNTFYSHGRRAWRESHLEDSVAERMEAPANEQEWSAELSDTTRALRKLPDAQRDAVILVGASGFSYKDAANICDTNIGTMKSRVARGRTALLSILDETKPWPERVVARSMSDSRDTLIQLVALASAKPSRVMNA